MRGGGGLQNTATQGQHGVQIYQCFIDDRTPGRGGRRVTAGRAFLPELLVAEGGGGALPKELGMRTGCTAASLILEPVGTTATAAAAACEEDIYDGAPERR